MEHIACNLCGNEDSTVIFTYARTERRNIRKCSKCGLVFLELGTTREEIEQFYKIEYRKIPTLPIQTPEQHYTDLVTQKDVNTQLEFILQNTRHIKGKSILEIGSASGGLLEALKKCGAKVSGIELNDEYRDFSKQHGLTIFSNPVEYLAHRKKKYDLIVAFHVVEHFVNPLESIGAIFSCLNIDGKFMGEVPNENEWAISIFDSETIKSVHYNPNHYYYFTEYTLARYLRSSGFGWMNFETVERYNSLAQLRTILSGTTSNETIESSVFPNSIEDDYRLRVGDTTEQKFNKLFGKAINDDMKGNILRFVAEKL